MCGTEFNNATTTVATLTIQMGINNRGLVANIKSIYLGNDSSLTASASTPLGLGSYNTATVNAKVNSQLLPVLEDLQLQLATL